MKIRNGLPKILALVLTATYALAEPLAPMPGQPATPTPADLPPGAAEVVRLSEAGTSEDVILSYIRNSSSRFNLTADQILYLRDIGFSSQVISTMLNRDNELQGQAPAYHYDQKLYAPADPTIVAPQPSAPATVPAQPTTPPPPAQAAAPVYVSSPPPDVTYFYGDLAPYGTWVDLDGIGWCWQPRVVVVNHAWRPYCDAGYWVYSDAGWYWQSTYSWGWAPFHYGRWQLHPRCGWVWLPDRVWGPSWVVWRSEGDHCGWAPLPPHAEFDARLGWRFNGVSVSVSFDFGLRPDHFTFIAMKDFSNHDLGHRCLAPAEVTRIYHHTTVINNYVINNNTVVNQGIKVDRVAAATHTQVQRVAIRDVPSGAHNATRTSQTVGKSTTVIYRPQLSAPAQRTTMVAQKVDDRHPVVQHTPIPPKTERPSTTARPSPPAAAPARSAPPANERNHQSLGSDKSAYQSRPPEPRGSVGPQASQNRPAYSTPEAPSSGEYHPKSYHQAAEIQALPPITPRADSTPGSLSNSGNSHSHKNQQGDR